MPAGRRCKRVLISALWWTCFVAGCDGCYKRVPVKAVEEMGYPTCGDETADTRELVFQSALRASEISRDRTVVERFRFEKSACHYIMTVRQEWPKGTADVEVIYDLKLQPLRAWKRTTAPSFDDPEDRADIRRYELRSERVGMKVRTSEGQTEYFELRGDTPTAVVGPGRGLLSAWIRRANLQVGEKSAETALDFRSLGVEKLDSIALRREPDRQDPILGKVRVYTVYGREAVFTDDQGMVIGDLAGLRPVELVDLPMPAAIPVAGTPDPRATP